MVKYCVSLGVLIAAAAACAYAVMFFAWIATVTNEATTLEQATAWYSVWEAGLWVCALTQVIVGKRALSAWQKQRQTQRTDVNELAKDAEI